jgi:uncharacterized membrane protein
MRPLVILGIVLILCGLFVTFRGVSYTSQRQVMKLGDLEATVEEKHTIPTWLGVVAIVGGIVLLGAGQRPRTTAGPSPHPSSGPS